MKNYKVNLIDKTIAKKLIVENHYTHKWSSCRYSFGLILNNKIVGVAIYGFPVGRQVVKSISNILENKDVLELTRLWVNDSEGKNTESWFIGQTFKWLRHNTNIKVLISYSDPLFNHVGYIYQSLNFLYQGNNTMLVKGFIHQINGENLHPRSCVQKYGTVKIKELIKIDPEYERIPMKKKHRYIYILTRNKKEKKQILKTLKHKILPYPKNNLNSDWV